MYFLQIVVRIGLFFTTIVMSRKVKGKLCLASHRMYETRAFLNFSSQNTSYDLLLPTWSVHYLFSLLWIPTKPRWFHRLLDKNPTKQRIIVDIWFRGRSLSQPPAQNEVTSKISPQLLPINTINGFHRIVPRILQRQVTYP